ncbi:MAG: gas vesicle protein K, partial [Candidatus Riflebacteria bacterium]|nr:gas vesicle protein K [Candidatus Riflebacteria bacterium]
MALLRRAAPSGKKSRINMDPENVRRGLGQLVLTIVELSRQLLERQAIRRVEAGGLTDGETERLGCAF